MPPLSHEDFAAEVTKRFEFLESAHQFRRHAMQTSGASGWIVYESPNVKVIVENEAGFSCGVTIQDLRRVKHDPLERTEFDIDEILAMTNRKPRNARNMNESIANGADALRNFGAAVLNGEFEKLHERQARSLETIRRNQAAYDITIPEKSEQ